MNGIDKALVTGGAGFIGSHLCDLLLEKGAGVRAVDDLSMGRRENLSEKTDLIVGDILDPAVCEAACEGVDTVFHLAAKVSIRHSIETFYDDANTNLMGTLNVLRAAAKAGARRFVLASTMGVYSDSAYGTLVTEEHPTKPLSPYGISKLAAESYVMMMGPQLGMQSTALRLFNTYGPRQGYTPYVGVITIFVNNILKGRPLRIFGDGRQCRDFVHVRDVARAFYLAAAAQSSEGGIFNIGTGIGTTVNEVTEMLKKHFDGVEVVHEEAHRGELYYSVPDISAARRHLGYEPEHSLAESLGELIEHIKSSPAS